MDEKTGSRSGPGGRPRHSEIESRQRKLLDAAAAMFIRDGYRGTSLERIATTARVSKSTIYARYGGKDGLLKAVVDHVLKNNVMAIDRPISARTGVAALKEQLANNIGTSLQPAYLGLFRLFLTEGANFPERFDAFSARGDAYQLLLNQIEQHDEFKDLLPFKDEIAYLLVSMTGMLVTEAVLQADRVAALPPEEEASRLVDICLYGYFGRVPPQRH